jgi:hypothetical protein
LASVAAWGRLSSPFFDQLSDRQAPGKPRARKGSDPSRGVCVFSTPRIDLRQNRGDGFPSPCDDYTLTLLDVPKDRRQMSFKFVNAHTPHCRTPDPIFELMAARRKSRGGKSRCPTGFSGGVLAAHDTEVAEAALSKALAKIKPRPGAAA